MNPGGKPCSISATIICCNEAAKIRACLEAVKWCDEIVVVDSGSTDGTVEICRQYTDKIFHNAWHGYCAQKAFALSKCREEWVLNVDADEIVSPELAAEIQAVLSSPATEAHGINGFYLLRTVFCFGKWWRKGGWYPEYRLRLCRRKVTRWGGEDPHEHAIVTGPVARLQGELLHYTYDSITDQVGTINSFSSVSARSLFVKGKRSSLPQIFLRPVARFFKFYALRKGYREGLPGLAVAVLESYYVFLKYLKLWEIEQSEGRQEAKEVEQGKS